MPELTLGHTILAAAAIELVLSLLLGRMLLRAGAELGAPPERRRAGQIIIAAGLAGALILGLAALFLPEAGLRLT